MPITLSRAELCRIVGGTALNSEEKISCSGVELNPDDVRGGELFIALRRGGSSQADLAAAAFARGAALALVEDETLLHGMEGQRFVAVPSSLGALHSLAAWWRQELKLPAVAIGGGLGRTAVKELLAAILLQADRGVYSLGSHDSNTDAAYTILRAGPEHRWIIIEMDADQPGVISTLSKLSAPDVAVITGAGGPPPEQSGAQRVLEIVDGLSPQGTLIANGADSTLAAALNARSLEPGKRLLFFGAGKGGVQVVSVEGHGLEGITAEFEISTGDMPERIKTKLDLIGTHQTVFAAAAILAARSLRPELPLDRIERGLQQFRSAWARLNLKTLEEGRFIYNDSDDGGPESVLAFLSLAEELQRQGKRTGFILGDMLGLGELSEPAHRKVAERLTAVRPAFVVAVGEFAKIFLDAAKKAGIPAVHAENPEVAAHIARKLRFDILLIKGSPGMGLDRTVTTLESVS